jgi:hypothetical protein
MTGVDSIARTVSQIRFAKALVFSMALLASRQAYAVSKFFVPPAANPGDYNNDGTINPPDFNVWTANFGSTTNLAADGNANGVVDAADYTVWRDHLGASAAPVGVWEDPTLWNPAGLPGQFDGAIIHANRTCNVSTDTGFIAELRIGDTVAPAPTGGTLNINPGGKVTTLGQVIMGASNPGQYKQGNLNLNGGSLVSFGAFFVAFEPEATETITIGPGSTINANQDMFGRFGKAFINQTGGVVSVHNNLIWGEGGDPAWNSRSEYNLSGGQLTIGQALAIGGDVTFPAPNSNGRVNVSGGSVTANNLVFDTFPGEEAILSISGSGIVRINQANYSTSAANADIAGGFIIGSMLSVSTVNVSGTNYTQIVSTGGTSLAVPEPDACVLLIAGLGAVLATARRNVWRRGELATSSPNGTSSGQSLCDNNDRF